MKNKALMSVKNRILNILFWSIISAAFIGPGTVTTATKAGADCQFQLLWALSFSTLACLVLQEASARATIYSGKNLGLAIKDHFMGRKSQVPVLVMIVGAIILGCAAYETGNILGSVEGLALVFPKMDRRLIVAAIAVIAALALSLKSMRSMANFMGSFVFIMGATFVTTAVFSKPPIDEVIKGALIPTLPDISGAGLLILSLVGTTVVPYDLFLGSNVVQKDTTVKDMRIGISTSIILGGLISMAILCVGAKMTSGLDPEAIKNLEGAGFYKLLSQSLTLDIGQWAVYIFGFGMFAAGFTSAITSPLASALTAKSIFQKSGLDEKAQKRSNLKFQILSYIVLVVGITCGLLQKKPVPAIVAAQAFNGLILPFVAIFLFTVVNDKKLMGRAHMNGWFSNIMMVIVTFVTLILGFVNICGVVTKTTGFQFSTDQLFLVAGTLAFVITLFVTIHIFRKRAKDLAMPDETIENGLSEPSVK